MGQTEQSLEVSAGDILRDLLAKKMTKNPGYSMRAFARNLGVSHTYLSLVLSGKKPLSMKKIVHFSHILGLDERHTDLFMKAGAREARTKVLAGAGKSSFRSQKTEENYFEAEDDQFSVLAEWYHLPILDLTFLKGFDSDPKWIAKKLGISVEQVKSAIERLKRMRLLKEVDGKLVKTKEKLLVHPKNDVKARRTYYQKMMQKAWENLESNVERDVQLRDMSALTVPIDPALIPAVKEKIKKFTMSLWKFMRSGENIELFQLNVQLFPLTVPDTDLGKSPLNSPTKGLIEGTVLKKSARGKRS